MHFCFQEIALEFLTHLLFNLFLSLYNVKNEMTNLGAEKQFKCCFPVHFFRVKKKEEENKKCVYAISFNEIMTWLMVQNNDNNKEKTSTHKNMKNFEKKTSGSGYQRYIKRKMETIKSILFFCWVILLFVTHNRWMWKKCRFSFLSLSLSLCMCMFVSVCISRNQGMYSRYSILLLLLFLLA